MFCCDCPKCLQSCAKGHNANGTNHQHVDALISDLVDEHSNNNNNTTTTSNNNINTNDDNNNHTHSRIDFRFGR